ncbi:uncharacterized protein LOC130053140 [Ostrea edulis]|uniref:uncharacterized protein LOC130053140 n=1 Tax=Ostrea edulis TaxID=37623 RepID=UPI0024AEBBF8|nr:uncharacterized protein LOC130053140 [Ostrea edulis]
MVIWNILHVIFISPFRFGNPTVADISDGRTSSTVLFACASAISLISNVYLSIQPGGDQTANNMLWILQAFSEVAGTIALVILLVLIRFSTSYVLLRRQQVKDKSINVHLNILWLSGLGVLVLTGISLVITIKCIYSEQTSEGALQMISTILTIPFIVLQLSSITYLRNVSLAGGMFINYLVGTILLVNVSMWFSFVTWKIVDIHTFLRSNFTKSIPKESTFAQCYLESGRQNVSWATIPFSLSISMLFFILSSVFLIKIWSSIEITSHIDPCKARGREGNDAPQLPESIIQPHEQNGGPNLKNIRFISTIVGITLVVAFLTMALLMKFVYLRHIIAVKIFWDASIIACLAIGLIIVLVGIKSLDSYRPITWMLSSWDCVLLCCMAGNVVNNTIGIISVSICHVERPKTIFTKNSLNLFMVFYHTVYIMMARRIPSNALRNKPVTLSVHIVFFVSYAGRWFLLTFILSTQGKYLLQEGQQCLFSDQIWLTLQYFTIPINAFYDFQSFAYYYSTIW